MGCNGAYRPSRGIPFASKALAVDFHEHLVEVPSPWTDRAQALGTAIPDLGGEHRAEPLLPEPERLVAHIDATLVQQVFDVPKRKRKRHEEHHGVADDLRLVRKWRKGFDLIIPTSNAAALPRSTQSL
jgi:hypothetical protein